MRNVAVLMMLFIVSTVSMTHAQRHKERRPAEQGISSFVELFTKLERDWTVAIQNHDQAALDKLLAPEFIVRNAGDAAHIIDRSQWLQQIAPSYKISSFSQSGMTVRVFPGDIALVSFVQSQKATVNNSDENGRFFIVDVWTANRSQNQWQAAQRYWAPIARRSSH